MKGLKGREVLPTPTDLKSGLEDFARKCQDWKASQRTVCTTCFREWWRPAPVLGDECDACCSHKASFRGYMIKGNGEACPQVFCVGCGRRGDISRHDLAPVFDLVFRNNLVSHRAEPCAHCGAQGAELHHWAPSAIFNDADTWPKSWLCPTCHRAWHSAMREARGLSLPPEQRKGPCPSWWYSQESA